MKPFYQGSTALLIRTYVLCIVLSSGVASAENSGFRAKLTPAPNVSSHVATQQDANTSGVWIRGKYRIFINDGEPRLGYQEGNSPEEAVSAQTVKTVIVNSDRSKGWNPNLLWGESVFQPNPATPDVLYMITHNENTWKYYKTRLALPEGTEWPAKGEATGCRIVLMKSTDGGSTWRILGNLIEDDPSKFFLESVHPRGSKPTRRSYWFPGGVGDASAVSDGRYLYVFYSEESYPTKFDPATYKPELEAANQGISVARILIADLLTDDIDHIQQSLKRWDGARGYAGKAIDTAEDARVENTPIPGFKQNLPYGPMSKVNGRLCYAPSISYNEHLHAYTVFFWYMSQAAPPWVLYNYMAFNSSLDPLTWERPQKIATLNFYNDGEHPYYPVAHPIGSAVGYWNARLDRKARFYTVGYYNVESADLHSNHYITFLNPGEGFVDPAGSKTAFATNASSGHQGVNAVDGDPETYWEDPLKTAHPRRDESPSIVYDRGNSGWVAGLVLKGIVNIHSLVVQTWDQDKNDAGDWAPDNSKAKRLVVHGGSELTIPIRKNVRYIRITVKKHTDKPRIAEIAETQGK